MGGGRAAAPAAAADRHHGAGVAVRVHVRISNARSSGGSAGPASCGWRHRTCRRCAGFRHRCAQQSPDGGTLNEACQIDASSTPGQRPDCGGFGQLIGMCFLLTAMRPRSPFCRSADRSGRSFKLAPYAAAREAAAAVSDRLRKPRRHRHDRAYTAEAQEFERVARCSVPPRAQRRGDRLRRHAGDPQAVLAG